MRRDFYRRFAPLFVCQFTNAFSDNLFRSAFAAALTVGASGAGGAGGDYATVVAAAPGVFILPFFLFSAMAGEIADKSDKTKMLRIVKCAEIVVVLLSLWAWRAGSPSALLAAIFLFGAQSAFFGPLKYSLLAEQARADELLLGNALFTSSTFAAILLGWICGAWLGAETNGGLLALAAPLCVFSLAGVVGAFLNPRANPDFRDRAPLDWRAPWRVFASALRAVKNDPFLRRAVLALSWFWLLGALLLTELPIAAGEMQIGRGGYLALLASLCVGAGAGAFCCHRFFGGQIDVSRAPTALLTAACCLLFLSAAPTAPAVGAFYAAPGFWAWSAGAFATAAAAAFFALPIYAAFQRAARGASCARAIAALNICNAIFIVGGAIFSTATHTFFGAGASGAVVGAAGASSVAAWLWARRVFA